VPACGSGPGGKDGTSQVPSGWSSARTSFGRSYWSRSTSRGTSASTLRLPDGFFGSRSALSRRAVQSTASAAGSIATVVSSVVVVGSATPYAPVSVSPFATDQSPALGRYGSGQVVPAGCQVSQHGAGGVIGPTAGGWYVLGPSGHSRPTGSRCWRGSCAR
jgi:hypothetical protein